MVHDDTANQTERDLIIAANAEPYQHEYTDDGDIAADMVPGGLTAGLDPIMRNRGRYWVGWGRGDADFADGVVDNDYVLTVPPDADSDTYNLQRVKLSDDEADDYYLGMSNQVLWPAFHRFTDTIEYEDRFWDAYTEVNERYADYIEQHAEDDDIIQVHDYHLLLVPDRINDADTQVGFFSHIPTPTVDDMEQIPHGDELFDGMSGADLIGVHTERDVDNVLDVAAAQDHVDYVDRDDQLYSRNGDETQVAAIPLGIDTDRFTEKETNEQALRDEFDVDHLLFQFGRSDYTKGWLEGLDAYETLLEQDEGLVGRDLAGDIVLYQNVTESRQDIPVYREYMDSIRERTAEINREHGTGDWEPVVLEDDFLSLRDLVATYRAADVVYVPTLVDGMNLVAKEGVAANYSGDHDGMLVLGENAGAAEQLDEAMLIDPQDTDATASALADTLQMSDSERRNRMAPMFDEVREHDIDWWATTYLDKLADSNGV